MDYAVFILCLCFGRVSSIVINCAILVGKWFWWSLSFKYLMLYLIYTYRTTFTLKELLTDHTKINIPYNGAQDDMEQDGGELGRGDMLALDGMLALDDMELEHMVVDELNTQLQ